MNKKVLVVGCGSIGERHLRCLLATGRANVFACESKTGLLEKMRSLYNVPGWGDMNTALAAEQFDGIIIATPAHTHIPMSMTALRSCANLLIEKPLSVGLEGVLALQNEVAKRKAVVGVGYMYRFIPVISQAREFLSQGTFGKPLHAVVTCGQHFPTFRPAYRETYYTRHETGGGSIQDGLTHLVNTIEWMIGPTTRVFCDASLQALEGVEVEDTVGALGRNGGALVTYSLNQFQAPNEMTYQINCQRGSVKLELHEQRWAVLAHGDSAWTFHPAPTPNRDDWYIAQANFFLDAVEGKDNRMCSLAEAVQTLKFNMAALESARSGLLQNIAA